MSRFRRLRLCAVTFPRNVAQRFSFSGKVYGNNLHIYVQFQSSAFTKMIISLVSFFSYHGQIKCFDLIIRRPRDSDRFLDRHQRIIAAIFSRLSMTGIVIEDDKRKGDCRRNLQIITPLG